MAKFDNIKVAKGIKEVAQASNEQATLITIKYYKDEDLIDYPRNNEDISYTEDIEKSIMEQGFTDPIEITDFGMTDGKFTIVSGHRRRMAGRKQGMSKFPCILRHFKSGTEVYNYVLYSNSQRDSAKDPLLFAKRYKMHEEYLKESGFNGSYREEIASRLGLKTAQADRYNQMNKVILPVWDMIRDGIVGMSSITDSGMYTHTLEEQTEILSIMRECLDNDTELTRPVMKKIVKGYRDGGRTWSEITQDESAPAVGSSSNGVGVSVMNVNTEPTETSENEPVPFPRNNEVNYDYSHREGMESGIDPLTDERLTEEDMQAIEKAVENDKANEEKKEKEKKPPLTEEEQKLLVGEKISKNLSTLDGLLNDFYKFEDAEQAELTIKTMTGLIKTMFAEMQSIGESYDKENVFDKALSEITKEIDTYNE